MSGSKTSPHIRPQQAQRLMNPSASLCFPMFNHLFGSDLCSLPVFHSLPLQSFYLTGADEARHAQLFGWMMYHWSLGLQSGHVLYCYNNISPTCLIYSCELKQGQTAFTYLRQIETNRFNFMTSLFLMFQLRKWDILKCFLSHLLWYATQMERFIHFTWQKAMWEYNNNAPGLCLKLWLNLKQPSSSFHVFLSFGDVFHIVDMSLFVHPSLRWIDWLWLTFHWTYLEMLIVLRSLSP